MLTKRDSADAGAERQPPCRTVLIVAGQECHGIVRQVGASDRRCVGPWLDPEGRKDVGPFSVGATIEFHINICEM